MGILTGRNALITGGGRGIGRSIALALAAEGAKIAVTARTRAEIDAVAAEALDKGAPQALAVTADAMDAAEQRAAVREAIAAFGHIDILVNNAGGVDFSEGPGALSLFGHSDAAFRANLDLNLSSAFWTIAEAAPHMRDRRYGRIINLGSGYSHHGGGFLSYVTAKHAIVGLTRAAATELASHGVTVNCLCPGWTNTSLVDFDLLAAANGTDAQSERRAMEAECLQKRILEPDEIQPMAVLLASEQSGAITGQVIRVDGGYRV